MSDTSLENLKRTGVFVHCRRGKTRKRHIIGEVVYVNEGYPEMLYRYCVSLAEEPAELPELDLLISWARHIRCTICDSERNYEPSPKAVKAMAKHDPRIKKFLEEMLEDSKTKKETEEFLRWVNS